MKPRRCARPAQLMRAQSGFTLLELILVLVIMGLLAGTLAVFMRSPVDAYLDTGRRAAMSDAADTALRRMSRELRQALPNSVRSPTPQCIEFIPTRAGARYRVNDQTPGDNTGLDFSQADTQFNLLAQNSAWPSDQQLRAGDLVAIYNLGPGMNDAYTGDNTAVVSAVTDGPETVVRINAKQFPLASPSNRLHVIPGDEAVVSYQCLGGRLLRMSQYAPASCPASVTAPARQAVLADNVSSCNFSVGGDDLQRNSLLQLMLGLSQNNETIRLYSEVHISNVP